MLQSLTKRLFHVCRVWIVVAGLLCAGTLPGRSHAQGQPTLPVIKLSAGLHIIRAEVANTHESRMTGLMFRQSLPLNGGMLFVFDRPERQCFWMKNTPLPLSIAFVANDGRIVNIADMAPLSEDSHCSAEPVAFALEMQQGWFKAKGIKPGSKLQAKQLFR